MALSRRSPFRLLRDLDRQLSDVLPEEDGESQTSITRWSPKVDIYEQGENIVFEVEAPGVEKDDIDISIEENRLVIQGERTEQKEWDDDRNYYRSERFYGNFQRSFALPEAIDAAEVTATYDDGVLKVTLPKVASSQSQSIQIQ